MDALLSLFVNAGDAAFAVDRRQTIVFWNDAASELLGYDADAATGRFCWRLLQGETPDEHLFCRPDCAIFQQLRRRRAIAPFSLLVRRADDTLVPVEVSTLPVDGQARGRRGNCCSFTSFAGRIHAGCAQPPVEETSP